jgi:DNA ligase D-like protein (predicted 3'-phosphoesterase)
MGKLEKYRRKRGSKSPEPRGSKRKGGGRRFVVQEHDARSHHYDFRLEVDGVLKSWAVPKGPSKEPSTRRLAIMTEDHPLDYADFEGEIPKGEYGAGTVKIWDRGRYRNRRAYGKDRSSMSKAIEEGLVEVTLNGGKLNGGYALKRIDGRGEKSQWLLIRLRE